MSAESIQRILDRTLPQVEQACREGRGEELLLDHCRALAEDFAATCLLRMTLKAQSATEDNADEVFAWCERYPVWCVENLVESVRSTYAHFGAPADAPEVLRAEEVTEAAFIGHLTLLMETSHQEAPHDGRLPILGIDIGISGAVAWLTAAGDLIDVIDMPILPDGPKGRSAVNAPLLALMIWKHPVGAAFVEYVGARPGEAANGAFAFGRARGVVEGVLGAAEVPVTFLTPPTWKRAVGIPPGKEGAKNAARAEAIRRWPARADRFARVKDDGRAEAALIAVAGLMRRGGPA